MSVERNRLLSLIEFAQQSARLRGKPAASVAAHGIFALYEHEIQGLPGIRFNVNGPDSEDEIWLAVERLHEMRPPDIASAVLRPWVQMTQAPTEEPRLREATDGASLVAEGTHSSSASPPDQGKPVISPETTVMLSDYDRCALVKAQFATYLDTKWRPWAEEEKRRRKTIRLYSQLFTLKQQLEGGIVEAQLELVWGVGLGIWNSDGATVSYPLVGRLAEMSLNPVTAEVELRPRDVDARIEVDWYASVDNPGVTDLEKAAKEFFGKATTTYSPFDRGTFEPLLRTAATNLDANGIYWPNEVSADDRTLPRSDDKLKVTDTWVLFARPRSIAGEPRSTVLDHAALHRRRMARRVDRVQDNYDRRSQLRRGAPDVCGPAVALVQGEGVAMLTSVHGKGRRLRQGVLRSGSLAAKAESPRPLASVHRCILTSEPTMEHRAIIAASRTGTISQTKARGAARFAKTIKAGSNRGGATLNFPTGSCQTGRASYFGFHFGPATMDPKSPSPQNISKAATNRSGKKTSKASARKTSAGKSSEGTRKSKFV